MKNILLLLMALTFAISFASATSFSDSFNYNPERLFLNWTEKPGCEFVDYETGDGLHAIHSAACPGERYILHQSANISNAIISTQIQIIDCSNCGLFDEGTRDAGVFIRTQGGSFRNFGTNTDPDNGYVFQIHRTTFDEGLHHVYYQLYKYVSGVSTLLNSTDSGVVMTIPQNWSLTLDISGSTISAYKTTDMGGLNSSNLAFSTTDSDISGAGVSGVKIYAPGTTVFTVNFTFVNFTSAESYSFPPFNLGMIPPTSPTHQNQSWFYFNVSYEGDPANACKLVLNTSTTQTNYSMIVSGNNNCYLNLTGLSDGIYSYAIYANDSSNHFDDFSNTTFSKIYLDLAPPSALTFVAPSTTGQVPLGRDWIYVNMTFFDTNPDSCVLNFSNTLTDMTRSGLNCYLNYTFGSPGNWGYSVIVNDTSSESTESSVQRFWIDGNFSGCGFNITQPGNYAMNDSISCTSPPYAISILSSSVNLDCKYHTLNGAGLVDDGIFSTQAYVNISNCFINNFAANGVNYFGDQINNVEVTNTPTGVNLLGDYSRFQNLTVKTATDGITGSFSNFYQSFSEFDDLSNFAYNVRNSGHYGKNWTLVNITFTNTNAFFTRICSDSCGSTNANHNYYNLSFNNVGTILDATSTSFPSINFFSSSNLDTGLMSYNQNFYIYEEMDFHANDRDSAAPVPNAVINISDFGDFGNPPIANGITDANGFAPIYFLLYDTVDGDHNPSAINILATNYDTYMDYFTLDITQGFVDYFALLNSTLTPPPEGGGGQPIIPTPEPTVNPQPPDPIKDICKLEQNTAIIKPNWLIGLIALAIMYFRKNSKRVNYILLTIVLFTLSYYFFKIFLCGGLA